jgi:hypothetical protein
MPAGDDVHATRRGGARHDLSARVTLTGPIGPSGPNGEGERSVLEGWALNISRGGIRVILEQRVELGSEYEVTVSTGDDPSTPRVGRIVWTQEEPDGVVAGIEFRGESGTHKFTPPEPREPQDPQGGQ